MKRAIICLLLLYVSSALFAERKEILLNENWKFRFTHQVQHKSEQRVNMPHKWNSGDALSGKQDYYRGMGNYTKTLYVDPAWEGKRLFLRFEGVNTVADLFINDVFVGEHRGGYGAFVFEITDKVKYGADNRILVKVSNALHLDVMPLVGDFNFYGGIYRDVHLVITEPVNISLTDYASPGVYLVQNKVTKERADVHAKVIVSNGSESTQPVQAHVKIWDGDKLVQEQKMLNVTVDPHDWTTVGMDLTIQKPHLWNGRKDPFLYRVEVTLFAGGKEVDRVVQPLGLRFFHVDAEKGFFLNGEHLKLQGVCRHQDRAERGNALFEEHHEEDAAIMAEMGVNAVRLSHYPQASYFYDLMDRYGIVVWTEIPQVGPGGYQDQGYNNLPAFRENGKEQLKELIRQHYNHPSICFWGLYNELKTIGDNPTEYIGELNELAHQEDPTRLTTAASFLSYDDPISAVTDLIAWNQYFGWYGGAPSEMGEWLDANHKAHPEYKIAISEYGAGASIYHQQDSLKRGDASGWWHPENYQTYYHIENWKALAERPFVWGSFLWNMFDFGAAHRTEGDRPGINDKGLVTFDRKVKKDAFYFYKANWNKVEPFVYIANRRHRERTLSVTDIQIFSNQSEVELFVNGKSQGRKQADDYATFEWKGVALQAGDNRIEVRSTSKKHPAEDHVIWHVK